MAKRGIRRRHIDDTTFGYLLLLPSIIVLIAITIYPTIFAIDASLRNWIMYRPELGRPFIGLDNYIEILSSPKFWKALKVTLTIVGLGIGLTFLIGFAEALLVSAMPRGRGPATSILITPLVITPVVVSLAWRFMYHEGSGLIIAHLLPLIGINLQTIVADPNLALYAVIAADVWNQTPMVFLILLAGIQSLPQTPYEAAKVDGASTWQTFRHITLPLLRPVILIALILRSIDTFRLFDIPWVMTQGGPGTATTNLVIEGYLEAFTSYYMGMASAYGIIVLYIVLAVSLVYIRILVGRER